MMNYFKLSAPQKLIQSMDDYSENSITSITGEFIADENINEELLKKAYNKLIENIETLRTRIERQGDEVFQYYAEYEYDDIPVITFKSEKEKNEFAEADAKKRVPLYGSKLYRSYILKCSETSKISLIMTMNHIIGDAWGVYLLKSELAYYCDKMLHGEVPQSTLLEYRNYIKKDEEYHNGKRYQKDKNYWLNEFDDFEKQGMTFKSSHNTASERMTIDLTETESECFNKLVSALKTTPNNLMMSFLLLYLHITENSKDICIGTELYNRMDIEDKKTMGMMVNTVAFRYIFDSDYSFCDYVKRIEKRQLSIFMHQRFNYGELLEELRKLNRNETLYDIAFNYQIIPEGTDRSDVKWYHCGNIDELMVMTLIQKNNSYSIAYDYKTDCLTGKNIEYIHERIMKILEQTCLNSDLYLSEIYAVTDKERLMILNDFNATDTEYQRDKTVVELFEEQVRRTPDNTALVFMDKSLTYAELNRKANCIAHKLRKLGVKPDDFIAVIADRSIEMIAGIYGIIKSGGAYVPIDPTYPEERIRFMLEDCKPKAVLKYTAQGTALDTEITVIDLAKKEVWEGESENPELVNGTDDLIYCIYTSGTTGTPKGVTIEHHGVSAMQDYLNKLYEVTEKDNVLQFANYIFDASVWEMTLALYCGATLVLVSTDIITDTVEFEKYARENNITLTLLPPQYFRQTDIESLRILTTGGSASDSDVVRHVRENCRYINAYGPTENTVLATHWEYERGTEVPANIPIGRPVSNSKIYIANGNSLCGIGVPGELCITGAGLARGYLNRPELTKEKFVNNPFGEGRMYRSGDLARWLPDGNIEYLGRIDDQVKIRGFRIELGEIESRIREIDNISDCVVIAKSDSTGDKAIYAYYTSDEEKSVSEIRDRLSESMPSYMVPSYMMQIEEIPVTRNGKPDKRALPEIKARVSREYIAPRNESEEIVCRIFGEILSIEKVGVKDSFFELGGHSLRATKLVNEIEAQTGVRIQLKEVFAHPTPEQLVQLIENTDKEEYISIPKAEDHEYYEMSASQKRMYLIQQMYPDSVTYNMPVCYKVKGMVDADRIQEILQKMADRHEMLRTRFVIVDGTPMQKIEQNVKIELEVTESEKSDNDLMNEFIRAFDLSVLPLIHVKLVRKKEYSLMLFDMHHIIGDGMSVNIFIREFNAFCNGEEPEPLTHQFRDYSEWMRTRDMSEGEEYWQDQFNDEIPVLNMPADYPRPQEQSSEGGYITTELNKKLSEKISRTVQKNGVTDYMLFLAALMVTLSKYSRQNDIVIGSPISGRTHKDTENMLGVFINTLAMRGKPEGQKSFSQFLEEIKQSCLKAYEYQEYPFEELVEKVGVTRDVSRNPLFDVLFTMQNNEEIKLTLGGAEIVADDEDKVVSKFDLSIDVVNQEGIYNVRFEYCSALFRRETAREILDHYLDILDIITDNIDIKINSIEMISEPERRKILDVFNPDKKSDSTKTIIDMFEQQVTRTPDSTAVIFDDKSLTYSELNAKANSVAHYLRKLGVKPDDFVALIADRSLEMIVGIYGIMKSGGAYVPMDPTYPEDRISYMIEDCQPKAVVKYTDEIIALPAELQIVDLKNASVWEENSENPECVTGPRNLVYCIYTSGTTGKPKGVMIEHRNLASYVSQFCDYFAISDRSVVMQQAYIGFDTSVEEIFPVHVSGGRNVVISKEVLFNKSELRNSINRNGINLISCSPLLIREMEYLPDTTVKQVISGGDSLDYKCIDFLLGYGIDVYNTYGPTESTVCASYYKVDPENRRSSIPIGKPIETAKIYIVDNDQNLCGIGVPGELCISGAGLARGYLNRPDLTSEKFVYNDFSDQKMYRSGDLAKWLPDGNIEYLGRIDDQVKIRGFRIELGEIENRIRDISMIRDCVVIVRNDRNGEKALYAYYCADEEIDKSEIKNSLRESLPEYMIPTYMMQIDRIPVTKNSKVDKRSLPEITNISEKENVKPRNEIEQRLLEIYKDVINTEEISVTDNFFDIGGNSLKIMQVFSKLSESYPDIVKVVDLFANPSIEMLSKFIEKKLSSAKITQILGVKLPEEFFGASGGENEKVTRTISEKVSKAVIAEMSDNLSEFLTAAYILTLSKISGSENITVECINDKSGKIHQITADLSSTENFFDIVETVKKELKNDSSEYDIRDFVRPVFENECTLTFLIVNGKLKYEYTELFDISLGITVTDGFDIECDPHHRSLLPSAASDIVEGYTQIITAVSDLIKM